MVKLLHDRAPRENEPNGFFVPLVNLSKLLGTPLRKPTEVYV
jgi:hypothetical protein